MDDSMGVLQIRTVECRLGGCGPESVSQQKTTGWLREWFVRYVASKARPVQSSIVIITCDEFHPMQNDKKLNAVTFWLQ